MNRFRLWDIQRKVMIYSDNNDYGVEIYLDGSFSVEFYRDGHWWCEDSDKYILMRSTGFSDKNGKKIFEKDILQYRYTMRTDPDDIGGTKNIDENRIHVVEFNITDYNSFFNFGPCPKLITCEVIGNIYENSDLLK